MVGCHSAVRLQYRYDCCAFLLPGAVDLTSMRHVAKNRPQELLLSVQTSKKCDHKCRACRANLLCGGEARSRDALIVR